MTKEKQKKSQKKLPVPIWVIVVGLAVIGLVVAGIVCLVLIKNGEAEDLRRARDISENTLSTREAVKAYFETKSETMEISEDNKEIFADFVNAVAKAGDYMRELGGRGAVKDGDAKTKFEEATAKFEKLQNVSETEQSLMTMISDGAFADEELDELINGKNEYLKNFAQEIKDYRTKVAEFNEKYADLKGKNKTELDADAAKIKQDGEDLAKKYAEIKFGDVYGMSRDDILNFYATIEELNKILTEKN